MSGLLVVPRRVRVTGGLYQCRALFREHVAGNPLLVAAARAELGGHDLACWCPDDVPWCHADDWLALVNPGWVRPQPAQGALW